MHMEWRKCFRRKKAVIAALAAVLLMAILFNLADGMYRWHVQTSARLLKWVDFNVTAEAMRDALKYDVDSHGKEHEIHWIDLLACLGARYGGDFSQYSDYDNYYWVISGLFLILAFLMQTVAWRKNNQRKG